MDVAEFSLHTKPGHFDEVADMYSEFAESFLHHQPSLQTVLIVGDEASGLVRGLGVFGDARTPTRSIAIPSSRASTTRSRRRWRARQSASNCACCTATHAERVAGARSRSPRPSRRAGGRREASCSRPPGRAEPRPTRALPPRADGAGRPPGARASRPPLRVQAPRPRASGQASELGILRCRSAADALASASNTRISSRRGGRLRNGHSYGPECG
jgi:hypothetical protein